MFTDYDQFAEPKYHYRYFTGPNCPPCADQRTKDALKAMQKVEEVEVFDHANKEGQKGFEKYKVGLMPYLIKFKGEEEIGREVFAFGEGYKKLKDLKQKPK